MKLLKLERQRKVDEFQVETRMIEEKLKLRRLENKLPCLF